LQPHALPQVRNCYLVSLNDLDGSKDYVRGKIADYLNDLVDIGVKGFRVDASKHMWPGDLEAMQVREYSIKFNKLLLGFMYEQHTGVASSFPIVGFYGHSLVPGCSIRL
jgi:glycosidase